MKLVYVCAIALVAVCLIAEDVNAEEKKEEKVGTVIGIDLGTTYSCVGVYKNGHVEIIPNDQGNRITPSYVAFDDDERFIGDAAKNQASINPTNTVFDVKRLIGRKFTDDTVQKDIKLLPFEIKSKDGKPYINVDVKGTVKVFSPEEISAMILTKMKQTAEAFLGQDIKNAVITVPAYFNDAQRQATRDAGQISGLNVMRIINEPTAAAIAYGLDKKEGEKNILVFDLGGGTFDVSLLTIDGGVFEVVSTNGDTHLGGEDFDQKVMEFFITQFKKKTDLDIKTDKRALQKLRREVEKAKRALSSTMQTKLEIEALIDGKDFSETLSRAKFEELNLKLFQKTLGPIKTVLEDADLKKDQVDEIVLVGGSTRIPKIQQLIKDFFDGKEPNRGVNPDEAVAFGAALQGGQLSGEGKSEILLLDVSPLTLGIETQGGVMAKLIERNTVVPTTKKQTFSTTMDFQEIVELVVFEGERPLVKDNHELGRFTLKNIEKKPKGQVQIEVTFTINKDGILKVQAEEIKQGGQTGQKGEIEINQQSGRLSDEEIEEMVKDAERFAEEDAILKERIDAKTSLESYVQSVRGMIDGKIDEYKHIHEKMSEEDIEKVNDALTDAVDFVRQNAEADPEEYKEQKTETEKVVGPILSKYMGAPGGADDDDDDDEEEEDEDEEEEEVDPDL